MPVVTDSTGGVAATSLRQLEMRELEWHDVEPRETEPREREPRETAWVDSSEEDEDMVDVGGG